jgi:hypothetical protein
MQFGLAWYFGARFDLALTSVKEGVDTIRNKNKAQPSAAEGHSEL